MTNSLVVVRLMQIFLSDQENRLIILEIRLIRSLFGLVAVAAARWDRQFCNCNCESEDRDRRCAKFC